MRNAWTWRSSVAQSGLPPSVRHVLLTLSLHMNEHGEGSYPSQQTLAKETGLCRRTVVSALDRAHSDGWIHIVQHGFSGQKWRRNEYRAAWPKGVSEDEKGGATVAQPLLEGGATDDMKVVQQLRTNSPDNIPKKKISKDIQKDRDESGLILKALETVLDTELALEVIEYRKDIKKPLLSERGAKMLAKCFASYHDPVEAVGLMMMNNWQGFNPEWVNNKTRFNAPRGSPANGNPDPNDHSLAAATQRIMNRRNATNGQNAAASTGSGRRDFGNVELLPSIAQNEL